MIQHYNRIWQDTYCKTEVSLQKTLIKLKESGCTQIDTIKLLIDKLKLTLSEADIIVLNSEAWAKEKDETLKIRKEFDDII